MKRKLPKTATIIYNAPSKRSPYPNAPITDIDTESTPLAIERVRKIHRLRTNSVFN